MTANAAGPRVTLIAPAVVLVVTAALAGRDRLVMGEAALVKAVNGSALLGAFPIEQALLAAMQLGTLLGVVAVAVVMLLVLKPWQPAVGVLVAGLVGWVGAKLLKEMVGRGRPLELMDPRGLEIHTDYTVLTGPGYPSGHTTVAFAVATVVAPWVPARYRWLPWLAAGLVAVARVYVAAHFPLDVIGGAALGMLIGGMVNLAVGDPEEASPAS